MKKVFYLIVALVFILFGCKINESIESESSTLEISGVVKLPSGMPQTVNGYSINSFYSEPILSSNQYAVEVNKNDFNVQFLSSPTEKTILLGLTYPNQTDFTIDSKSTLLGLIFKLPALNSLTQDGKIEFMNKILTSPKYNDAISAIEAHIIADKDIFDTSDVVMYQKIADLFHSASQLRSGFGANGQVQILRDNKNITFKNPGVSFSQVIGIYQNNRRIKKIELNRHKHFATSISQLFTQNPINPTPNPEIIEKYTFPDDGKYTIKVRNGGFNPLTVDLENSEALVLNGINLIVDNIKNFIPLNLNDKCPSTIYNIIKSTVESGKAAMQSANDKRKLATLSYEFTKTVLLAIKTGNVCSDITPKGIKYIDKIFQFLKPLDALGKAGTVANNSIFAIEFFISSKSALDTTITIGTPKPSSLEIYSGNNQTVNNFNWLPKSLVVIVKDENGLPISGVPVHWSYGAGSGNEFYHIGTRDLQNTLMVNMSMNATISKADGTTGIDVFIRSGGDQRNLVDDNVRARVTTYTSNGFSYADVVFSITVIK